MVHDIRSTMFNQCYKTVFFGINFKIKGWDRGRAILKGGGVPWYNPLEETLYMYKKYDHYH